jgi:hypothetical protein
MQRSAAIVVGVFPTGTPGLVAYNVRDLGPVQLTRAEVIKVLLSVVDHLDRDPQAEIEWRPISESSGGV